MAPILYKDTDEADSDVPLAASTQMSEAVSTLQGQALLLCITPGHQPKFSEYKLLPHKWCVISQSCHLAALLGFLLCAMKANKGRSSSASQSVVGSKLV